MQFTALTSIGVETLLADELTALGVTVTKQTVGSVDFDADSILAQKVCLCSRLATRVLLKLDDADDIKDKTSLYRFAKTQPWQDFFGPNQTFAVEFNGTNHSLKNTQFNGLVIKDAVCDYFFDLYEKRPSVDKTTPDVRLVAKLHRTKIKLYVDYSGPRLSDRGYRKAQGKAPIREHLAAALVLRSGYMENQDKPLFDPSCGSGTLLIEAALMALGRAPGLNKRFAFERLPSFREAKFKELKAEVKTQKTEARPYLIGHDIDDKVLHIAQENAKRAGVEEYIQFQHGDMTSLSNPANRKGIMLANLPYGERLGGTAELIALYRQFGERLKKHFEGWQLFLLGTDESLFKLLKLAKKKAYKFKNGPLDTLLVRYEMTAEQVAQTERADSSLNFSESRAFANRLKKNIANLKSWRKREEINAFRAYDADIPEYNVAVDVYNTLEGEQLAVIFEYAAPKSVDEVTAERRLQDIVTLTIETLGISPTNVSVKVRKKQKGNSQYQRQEQSGRFHSISEFGAKLKINAFDYLDTGVFLDHRLARRTVGQLAKNKRVLNLFAYTGSASVHAAIGGAKSVLTVDMSNTYLNWAKDNFALNGLSNRRFRFIQADCLEWLSRADGEFDVIFLDPPTFSNSKRMKGAFDVQRDHVTLLKDAMKLLSKDGTLIFSNNKRGFKMDTDALNALGIAAENISDKTLSPDFKRNQQIHNAWQVTHA